MLAEAPQDREPFAVTSTGPADGATLARAPTEVGPAFTGAVDPNRSHIVVTDGSGTASARTAGVLRRPAPRRLSQPTSATAAGEVTAAYHVTVTDGTALGGSLRFTAPSGNDAGQSAPTSGHRHDIDPVSAVLLVADGITVLAVVVLLLRRPRRNSPGRR
jgi:methionine-rich copper-binding protein CopC